MKFTKHALALASGLALSVSANAALIVQDGSGGSIPDTALTNDVLGESSANEPAGFGANLFPASKVTSLHTVLQGPDASMICSLCGPWLEFC